MDRGKTVTKPLALRRLGLALSEKQIPQVVENLRSGCEPKEALERVAVLRRQMLYPPELRAHKALPLTILNCLQAVCIAHAGSG